MVKLVILSVKRCYRTVQAHLILLGFICCVFLLYRSCPLLFSLLISASPVLVCTAALLGTLLSFGQPNTPEIEKEERVSHDTASLKSDSVADSTVGADSDGNSTVEMFIGSQKGVLEDNLGIIVSTPLISDRSFELQFEEPVDHRDIVGKSMDFDEEEKSGRVDDVVCGRAVENLVYVRKDDSLMDNRKLGEHLYSLIQDDDDELENGELEGRSVDSCVGSSKGSKGKEVDDDEEDDEDYNEEEEEEEDDDDDDEDDESEDFESDRAESSSPDASLADILPLLDELHPLLLGEEASKHAHVSHDGSDIASEHSHKHENGLDDHDHDDEDNDDDDDDEDYEDDDEEEDDDDDDDNDDEEEQEEEEQGQEGKEDEGKSAISWTEDDQKNLMDLGTSEIERNKRLENLIARRRARQTLRLLAEKNLIDFGDSDLPFNVPPIATGRRNPFDSSADSYSYLGLPPIPGSAPSILLQRRNPFDLPYDPNEEKPDLKGDDFENEFIGFHHKETLLRRHESFRVGPSNLGGSKLRPYFVPEHLEGTSYGLFERQLSEVSDKSKVSSVPDTDSVTSTVDDRKVVETEGSVLETEEMANMDRVSLFVEHGSHSSVDFGGQDNEDQDEIEKTLGEEEEEKEKLAASLIAGAIEEENNSRSSSSVFSEVDEKIDAVKNKEDGRCLTRDEDLNEEQEKDVEFSFMNDQHKEPVYDSSPSAFEKHLSFSSDSSDYTLHDETNIEGNISQARSFEYSGDKNVSFAAESATEHASNLPRDVSVRDFLMAESLTFDLNKSVEEVNISQHEMQQGYKVGENVSVVEHVENIGVDMEASLQSKQDQDFELDDALKSSHIPTISDASHESSKEPYFMADNSSDKGDQTLDTQFPFKSSAYDDPIKATEVVSSVLSGTSGGHMIQQNAEMEPFIVFESTEQIDVSEGSNADEIHEDGEGKSTLTSKSSSVSSDSSDDATRMTEFDLRDHLAKFDFGGFAQFQSYEHSTKAFKSHTVYEASNEEVDALRGINEVFLSELDAVGDFSVHESVQAECGSSDKDSVDNEQNHFEGAETGRYFVDERNSEDTHEEKELDELKYRNLDNTHEENETSFDLDELKGPILEDTHEEKETSFQLNELKDRVLEDTHEEKETSFELNELIDSDTAESSSELPVLEVRSKEEIVVAFMQLNEGADLDEVIIPSSIHDPGASEVESSSSLHIVDARSFDDIRDIMKRVSEEDVPQKDASDEAQLEDLNSKLPVLEVRSVEDIEMAFLQMNEGADLEEVILPSSIIDLNVLEEGSSSSLHTVEAKSLDDIFDNMIGHVSEGPQEEKSENRADGVEKSHVPEVTNVSHEEPRSASNEAERTHEIHSANPESDLQEISRISHEGLEDVEVEPRKPESSVLETPIVLEDGKMEASEADASGLRENKVLSRSSSSSSSSSNSD